MNLALIIARAGSVRIKNKNIKNFYGKPVIAYPIQTLQKSKIFSKIYVSTDSKKIAKISKRYKANVPFLRPKNLANNKTSTLKVIKHFIKTLKISPNINICCVYPVSPLLTVSTLMKAYKKFRLRKGNFLVPIQKATGAENKVFKIDKRKQIIKYNNSKSLFKDTGQFYFGTAKSFIKKNSILFSGSTRTMLISKKSGIDVNTIDDWNLLKKLFKNKRYD